MRKIEILAKKILFHGWSTLTGYDLHYTFADGTSHILKREIYNSGDGAAALLFNPSKKTVLLVKQYRLAAHLNGHPDGFLLECCAGMLDQKEPEETMKNEIAEETGIFVSEIFKIGETFATPGAHMEKIYLFLAPYEDSFRKGSGGGLAEEHEDIEIVEFSYEEVKKLVKQGEISDSKTLILLQYGMLNGYIH
ncbi:MAG: NUDIX domain-containing protein [Saprospiraceae bacterium]|nr:NUDIX domain-containing protein [Saprospiraceae bacterium]